MEFASDKNSSQVNNSVDSVGSESEDHFMRRTSLPWVDESAFAFIGLLYRDGKYSLVLRKIPKVAKPAMMNSLEESKAPASQSKKPTIDFEILFDHPKSNHPVYFAKLLQTYFDVNTEYRRLAFFWIQMLKMKGVVGAERGYLSEEAYLLILISYLQKMFFLPRAQWGLKPGEIPEEFKQEKVKKKWNISQAALMSLSGRYGKDALLQLQEAAENGDEDAQKKVKEIPTDKIQVNYGFLDEPKKLREKNTRFAKLTEVRGRKSKHLSVILMKLCRKLVLSLSRKDLVFDPKKGKVYSKRSKNYMLVSIKDPFVKELNYGKQMVDKEKLKHLIDVLKSFMKAAVDGTTSEFFV